MKLWKAQDVKYLLLDYGYQSRRGNTTNNVDIWRGMVLLWDYSTVNTYHV